MVTLGDFTVWSILRPLGGTLGSLGGHFGALWDTLGSLWCCFWVYESCSGATFSNFQNMLIFLTNFNDFIYLLVQLEVTWGAFWGDFGALWRYFGATLG